MKKALILALAINICSNILAINNKPFVIPELKEWKGTEGNFTITPSTRIIINKEDARNVAEQLANDWQLMFGHKLQILKAKASKGDIILTISGKQPKEAYTINTTTSTINTKASTTQGLYWATRTILQIAEQSPSQTIPCGYIKDMPTYEMRGLMIDCGRKYIPLDYLANLTKIMAYYKMNTLQIHLNDNGFPQFFQNDWDKTYAGFRIESTTYPGLTSQDGWYGKDEFRTFQKDAMRIGVEIIPEIDAPAHTLAFTHYNKALGSSKYGLDHMDLFNPNTYTFLDDLFKEYLSDNDPIFVGPRVHIGTDEYSNRDSVVVEKFRYFTDRYIKYVESFGKQACIWGSLTHAKGKTPVKVDNVLMSAWSNGYARPKDMKALGYKLLSIPDGWVYIVPAAGYYYDYLNIQALFNEWTPAHIGGDTFPEGDPSIVGGMFAVWNDHVGNGISVSDIHHRVFPALQTIALKCWSATNTTTTFETFDQQRKQLCEAPGINELGRYKTNASNNIILSIPNYTPNKEYKDYPFIGYNYRVSFSIDAKAEQLGTILAKCPRSTFYLSDPIGGYLGYSRDGYLYTFSHKIRTEEKQKITIEGDNKSTRLYINDKLVEELNTRPIWYEEGKARINQTRTLVFPLQQSGNFKSNITNFKVEQI